MSRRVCEACAVSYEPTEAELRSTYPGGRLPGESKD